jgi:hypothetical protein
MLISSRTLALTVLIVATPGPLAAEQLILKLTHAGAPARGFRVTYHHSGQTLSTRTDSLGRARFDVESTPGELFVPYNLGLESADYVLTKLRGRGSRWRAEVVRSARWRLRTRPRACNEWLELIDIPRGALPILTANDVDDWYDSLSPRELENCETLHRIEQQVGSKAPWYFYLFKAMPAACEHGTYLNELDWTGWYRGLLEEATGASPGKCLEDWERWWSEKGYSAIPDPRRERFAKE